MTIANEADIGTYKKIVLTIQYILTVPDSLTNEDLLSHAKKGYFGL